ncbi:interleukin-13 receptor subunit alpha-2 isoform X1 [Oryzias melastigma]|uniref:Interleukin 13 receptor, alpha 2 n=2 Tax=Oryzias melastigma TaxID=30732 RepID=A0A3B3B6L7_ORYME|nr:interleukin-13 receptor subunit alpha-2 isoform X1 [Oryzias melastigma]
MSKLEAVNRKPTSAAYKDPPTTSSLIILGTSSRRKESVSLILTSIIAPMATKYWLLNPSVLVLLIIIRKESMKCNGLTVNPPESISVVDPGRLGQLEITWEPPKGLTDMAECSVTYHLEYFNTYKNRWSAVRTSRRSYSTQFDLMKNVEVRVYTLLDGPCTNNTEIKSKNYTELIQNPPNTGVAGTEIQDFICVFQNMEYTECKWRRSPKMPTNSQQNLYYWYKSLELAKECPNYVFSDGVRIGCNFTKKSLPNFMDINFCVNGSSPEGPLKTTFTSLKIQNQVKPAATEKLHLQVGADKLEVQWEDPEGPVPGQCLEWQVEHNQEGPNGQMSKEEILVEDTSLACPFSSTTKKNCFRVRSKMNKYCVDKGFWSDWSHQVCHPEKSEVPPEPYRVPVYLCVAAAVIAMLMLPLCVWAVIKMRNSKQEKKLDSVLTNLFTKSSTFVIPDVYKSENICQI